MKNNRGRHPREKKVLLRGRKLMDVAGVVVTHRPGLSLLRNLRALDAQLSVVYIVDNTPGFRCAHFFRAAGRFRSVRLLRLGMNVGIGAALNIGVQTAQNDGFTWVITLDQDSLLPHGGARQLRRMATIDADVAIVTPVIRDHYTQVPVLGTGIGGRRTVAITSGNLLRIRAWESVQGFDWRFFLDMVDYDFCLRLKHQGWTIRQCNDVQLLHRWGQVRQLQLFRTASLTLRVYPPFRRYLQARNSISLLKRHFGSVTWWCAGHAVRLLLVSAKVLLLEKNTREAWWRGLRAGWSKPDYAVTPLAAASQRTMPTRMGRNYRARLEVIPPFSGP